MNLETWNLESAKTLIHFLSTILVFPLLNHTETALSSFKRMANECFGQFHLSYHIKDRQMVMVSSHNVTLFLGNTNLTSDLIDSDLRIKNNLAQIFGLSVCLLIPNLPIISELTSVPG